MKSQETEFRSALIIGHPGHELRVYKFINQYKPRVYILTDGSGHKGSSRVHNTLRIITDIGATPTAFMGVFTDVELYKLILKGDFTKIKNLMTQLYEDLVRHRINLVFGDAIEGFNPVHDLCRYLINAMVISIEQRQLQKVSNFEFLLDGAPGDYPGDPGDGLVTVELNDDELERKIASARKYPEIEKDVTALIERFGLSAFGTECLRLVKNLSQLKNWSTDQPLYEHYGSERVQAGLYDQIITYQRHMRPLGEKLISSAKIFRK